MTHRDTLPRVSARSVGCSDAAHRKAHATPSETLGKTPSRSHERPLRGAAHAISMGYYQRSLVLYQRSGHRPHSGRGDEILPLDKNIAS